MEYTKLKVIVETPARLHLGILDVNGNLGRMYGSLGLAVQHPNVIIELTKSTNTIIEGEDQERVKKTSELFLKHFKIKESYQILVKKNIPSHVGLGSGTQIDLAIAKGLANLFNLNVSTRVISKIVGRGEVSGIGTAIFESGGFVVDGGKSTEKTRKNLVPPVIARHPFPEDWFMVVALPGLKKGINGKIEGQSLKKLPQPPVELVGKMCRVLIMKMIPALLEHDITNFGSSMTDLQIMTGDSFSSVQGGKFAGGPVSNTIQFLLDEGAYGAGQSSWGPTVYGLVEGKTEAENLLSKVQTYLDSNIGGYAFYTQGANCGAKVIKEQ